ncbi:MAG: hypothetical protein LBT76_02080 [Tannerella sp.]|jgi:hypothetical protein|nr:hypothetical protein [Tannerella sp.]
MKKRILLSLFCAIACISNAQITTEEQPYGLSVNGRITSIQNTEVLEFSTSSDPYDPLANPYDPRPNLITGENEKYCQAVDSWLTVFSIRYGLYQDGTPGFRRGKIERIYYKVD